MKTETKAVAIKGYEFSQPHGRVISLLLVLGPFVELLSYLMEVQLPPVVRMIFVVITSLMMGVIISKDVHIWKQK